MHLWNLRRESSLYVHRTDGGLIFLLPQEDHMPEGWRTCTRCGVSKPMSSFPLKYDASKPAGTRKSRCKACCNVKKAEARKRRRRGGTAKPSWFQGNPSHAGERFSGRGEHPNKYNSLLRKLRHAKRSRNEIAVEGFQQRLREEFGWKGKE